MLNLSTGYIFSLHITLIQEQLGHCLQHDAGPWESTGVFHRSAASGGTWWAGQERSVEYGHCSSALRGEQCSQKHNVGEMGEQRGTTCFGGGPWQGWPVRQWGCKTIHTNNEVNLGKPWLNIPDCESNCINYYVHVFGSEMTKSKCFPNKTVYEQFGFLWYHWQMGLWDA